MTQKSVFYKLPTILPGSTRTCGSASNGTARYGSTANRHVSIGKSGERAIRRRPGGTTSRGSNGTLAPTSIATGSATMTAPSANLSANYEAFQGPPSRRPFLRKPSSARAPLSSLYDRHGEAQPGKIEALLGCGSE